MLPHNWQSQPNLNFDSLVVCNFFEYTYLEFHILKTGQLRKKFALILVSNSLPLKKYGKLHVFFLKITIFGAYFESSVFFLKLKAKNLPKRGKMAMSDKNVCLSISPISCAMVFCDIIFSHPNLVTAYQAF